MKFSPFCRKDGGGRGLASPFPVSVANACQAIGMVPVHGGRTGAPGGRKFPEAGSRACREESRAHEDTAGCSPTSPGLWALDESCIPKHESFSSPQSTSANRLPGTLHKYKCCQTHTCVCIEPQCGWSMEWALQYSNLSQFYNSLFCWLGRPTLRNQNCCIQAEYYHLQFVSIGNSCRLFDNDTQRYTGASPGGKSGSLGKILRCRHGLRSLGASRKVKRSNCGLPVGAAWSFFTFPMFESHESILTKKERKICLGPGEMAQ